MAIKSYGWRKDSLDIKDNKYKLAAPTSVKFPSLIDLRPLCPPLPDQGSLGSCTANAIAFALQFEMMKQKFLTPFLPSRLLIYYMERLMENTVNSDSGAEIRDGIKCVANQGVTSDLDWPYVVEKFTETPPQQAFLNAQTFNALTSKTILYQSINQDINHLKGCLDSGYPIVFGFSVYESFESEEVAKTGIIPMPLDNENMVGGHAVCSVGSDDSREAFICPNWWGEWGDKGYFYLPYKYITNPDLASDFWKISMV